METCPCGNSRSFADCCEPLITGKKKAKTAEALMRSRYTAFAKGAIAYLRDTLAPEARKDFDEKSVGEWSRRSEWESLEIISTKDGGEDDTTGTVEFQACYELKGQHQHHHEVAEFRKENGQWFFVDGYQPKHQPVTRHEAKVGRNDPCPCGSGKKYKKCCAA